MPGLGLDFDFDDDRMAESATESLRWIARAGDALEKSTRALRESNDDATRRGEAVARKMKQKHRRESDVDVHPLTAAISEKNGEYYAEDYVSISNSDVDVDVSEARTHLLSGGVSDGSDSAEDGLVDVTVVRDESLPTYKKRSLRNSWPRRISARGDTSASADVSGEEATTIPITTDEYARVVRNRNSLEFAGPAAGDAHVQDARVYELSCRVAALELEKELEWNTKERSSSGSGGSRSSESSSS